MVFESGVFLFAEDCPYVAKYKKPAPDSGAGFTMCLFQSVLLLRSCEGIILL